MLFLTSFQFLTQLLTTKDLKPFSTHLVVRNGTMWKRAFQLLKMRKKEISWNIKTKCVTNFILTVRSSSILEYTCHYVVSTEKTNVYINFNKNNENLKIFLQVPGYLNTRKSFPISMFVQMISGKCDSYIFHFSTRFLTSSYRKKFKNFFP